MPKLTTETRSHFNDRIYMDITWTFYSGAHATISVSKEAIMFPENRIYGWWDYADNRRQPNISYTEYVENRNNYTLPPTHLMCIGLNFHKQKKHRERILNLSLYNAHNPDLYFSTHEEEPDGEGKYKLRKISFLPLIPSFTLTYKS